MTTKAEETREAAGDINSGAPAEKQKEAPVTENPEGTAAVTEKPKKKSDRRVSQTGIVHIQATFNNTIVTISDIDGNVVCWSTSGSNGFKGSKKGTHFAAQVAADATAKKAVAMGMRTVSVYVKGPGVGRESAIRSLQMAGLKVAYIRDVTPIPHNGCRPAKRRRV